MNEMPPCGRCGTPEPDHGEECGPTEADVLRAALDTAHADRDRWRVKAESRPAMPTRGQIAIAIGDGWYAEKNPFKIADDILALEPRTADEDDENTRIGWSH